MSDEEIDDWHNWRQQFLCKHDLFSHQKLSKPGFTPGYYTSRIRNTFKKTVYSYQNNSVPFDVAITQAKYKESIKTSKRTRAEMNLLSIGNVKYLPKCLLRELLTPD